MTIWNPSSPCGTNNSAVPVTVYVNDHAVCLALASWVTGETDDQGIIVNLDCERLGLKQDYTMTSPAIEGFQPYAQYRAGKPIMIQPGKGRILVIDRLLMGFKAEENRSHLRAN